jgi:hypothetical protein
VTLHSKVVGKRPTLYEGTHRTGDLRNSVHLRMAGVACAQNIAAVLRILGYHIAHRTGVIWAVLLTFAWSLSCRGGHRAATGVVGQ